MKKRILLAAAATMSFAVACTTTEQTDLSGMSFSDEPLTGKVIWNDLITEDLDAAKRFYGGLFGWTFEDVSRPDGNPYVAARSGDIYVAGLLAVDELPTEDVSRWLPFISVRDVDLALERSAAAGATVVAGPRNVNLGRVGAIIDPEGAVIGLASSDIGDPDDRTTSAAPGRVVWTELVSHDPAAAGAFYSRLAGYDIESIERRGGRYMFLTANGVQRAGVLARPAEQIEPVWLTYFGVRDPAAAATKAASLGGTVIAPPSAELRNGTMAIITDPTGAVLVLQKTAL